MASGTPKLSLAAQFDDFCRRSAVTESLDRQFLAFVKNQEECRKKWHVAELEVIQLRKQVEALKGSHFELERKLAANRDILEKEVKRREQCEEDLESKTRQLNLIRQFIMNDPGLGNETMEKLPFLSQLDIDYDGSPRRLDTLNESVGSVLSPSGNSLDAPDDGDPPSTWQVQERSCVEAQHKGVASPCKRKSQGCEEVVPKRANVPAPVARTGGKDLAAAPSIATPPAAPSSTAAAVPSPVTPPVITPPAFTRGERMSCCYAFGPNTTLTTPGRSGPRSTPRRTSSGGKLSSRLHDFCSKTVIRPEVCGPCGKRIKFSKLALKCARCRSTCHPECKDQVPLPCIRVTQTPTSGTQGYKGTVIADHVPPTSPMVPAIVVHCIQEVERRGLSEVGLYRLSGSKKEVSEIRQTFLRAKGIPNLASADIHVVCSMLKDFLSSLRETLITKSLWNSFVKAAGKPSIFSSVWATWQAVTQLPQPNRDTLAALVLHLQMVSESPETKMPVSNLARVFGPTVVGYSVPNIALVENILYETEKQAQV
ncbi:unnamed protein product, partial [Ixodes hexagonus]